MSLQQDLRVWVLWVLASTLGGALGGVSFTTEFFGVLFLFGVILGAAQALVLLRYIPLGVAVAGAWMGVSFSGWLAGWIVGIVASQVLTTLVPEALAPEAYTYGRLRAEVTVFAVWVTLAAFQGAALTLMIALTLGRRPLLALGLLWAVAGVLGAVLAARVSPYLSNATWLDPGASGGSLGGIVPGAVGQAAAGALYGAATGVVLAMIVARIPD